MIVPCVPCVSRLPPVLSNREPSISTLIAVSLTKFFRITVSKRSFDLNPSSHDVNNDNENTRHEMMTAFVDSS